MPNFDKRQSATRKTPDPSTKAFPGVIGGEWTRDAASYYLYLDRKYSVHGPPRATLQSLEGEHLANCTDFYLDGETVVLVFDGLEEDNALIVFPDRDPSIRGFGGEYMTTGGLRNTETIPPTLLSVVREDHDYLTFNFDRDVEVAGDLGQIKWMLDEDQPFQGDAIDGGNGTPNITIAAATDDPIAADGTVNIGPGVFEAVGGALFPGVTGFPITEA